MNCSELRLGSTTSAPGFAQLDLRRAAPKSVCADLRLIYAASYLEAVEAALDAFEATWGERFPMIVDSWRLRWSEISAFLTFPLEPRKVIYTTNAIEAAHRQVRKTIKSRGHFPTDDAALKLIYLSLR
ncbi:MAG: transposase, partial [Nannocystaceae bacterium]